MSEEKKSKKRKTITIPNRVLIQRVLHSGGKKSKKRKSITILVKVNFEDMLSEIPALENLEYLGNLQEIPNIVSKLDTINETMKNQNETEKTRLDNEKAEQIKSLESAKGELEEKLSKEQEESKNLRKEKTNLEDELNTAKVATENLRIEKSGLEEKLSNEQEESENLRKEKANLEEELNTKKIEVDNLSNEKNELEEKLSKEQEESENLREEKTNLEGELNTKKIEVDNLSNEKNELEEKLSNEQEESKNLRKGKINLEEKLDEERKISDSLRLEKHRLESELGEERQKLSDSFDNVLKVEAEIKSIEVEAKFEIEFIRRAFEIKSDTFLKLVEKYGLHPEDHPLVNALRFSRIIGTNREIFSDNLVAEIGEIKMENREPMTDLERELYEWLRDKRLFNLTIPEKGGEFDSLKFDHILDKSKRRFSKNIEVFCPSGNTNRGLVEGGNK
jgi:chromosome segregation ATPase